MSLLERTDSAASDSPSADAWHALDWLVSTALPAWLEAANFETDAATLRGFGPYYSEDAVRSHSLGQFRAVLARQQATLESVVWCTAYRHCWIGSTPLPRAPLALMKTTTYLANACGVLRAGRRVVVISDFRHALPPVELGQAAHRLIQRALGEPGNPDDLGAAWDKLMPIVLSLRETAPASVTASPVLSAEEARMKLGWTPTWMWPR